jgi:hypothetical protein
MPSPEVVLYYGLRTPLPITLAKHGLDVKAWQRMVYECPVDDEGNAGCMACGIRPKNLILNIDHEHVRGYANGSDEFKRQHHRGLVCHMCNRYRLARGATSLVLRTAAAYLDLYIQRRRSWLSK